MNKNIVSQPKKAKERILALERNDPYIRVAGKGNRERVVAINNMTANHHYAIPSTKMLRTAMESAETPEKCSVSISAFEDVLLFGLAASLGSEEPCKQG